MKAQDQRVVIPCCKSFEFIMIKDVVRCEGLQNYTRLYLTDETSIVSSYNIGTLNGIFENYNFFHCHKSHLINVEHVLRYYKYGEVEMIDTSKVPVARRRREMFVQNVIGQFSIAKAV